MKKEVMFFENGNTAVFIDGEQVPTLQKSWLLLFVKFLQSKKQNPEDFEYLMPNGRSCKLFKTEDGYNWKF